MAETQVALLQARARRDTKNADMMLLALRASGLLLASVPPAALDDLRPLVLAAAILRSEDIDGASLARRMVEFAITTHMRRLQGPPLGEVVDPM